MSSGKLLCHCLKRNPSKPTQCRRLAGRDRGLVITNFPFQQRFHIRAQRKLALKNFEKKFACGLVLYLTKSLYEMQRSIEAGLFALGKRAVWSTE
jgi:hypothetical protein